MSETKQATIDWNEASNRGLIVRINTEILHPLGLAMCRNVEDGTSPYLLVSDDGVWTYGETVDQHWPHPVGYISQQTLENLAKHPMGTFCFDGLRIYKNSIPLYLKAPSQHESEPVLQWSDDGLIWCDGEEHEMVSARCAGYMTRTLFSHSAQPHNTGNDSDKYRAELYDEVWQKARDMGFANVTEALARLKQVSN